MGSVDRQQNGHPGPNGTAHSAPVTPPAKPPIPVPSTEKPPPELAEPVTAEEAAEGGFGVFLMQQSAPVAPIPTVSEPVPEPEPAAAQESLPFPEELPQLKVSEPAPLLKIIVGSPAPSVPSSAPAAPLTEPIAETAEAETLPAETASPPDSATTTPESSAAISKRAQSNSPPPTQAPAPMSASTLQKMRDQGMYRNQYFKDAECFECNHKSKVSRSSRSANCPACGAVIAMEDVEINMQSNHPIKTRGDVLIRKRGVVSTDSVRCKDLRCYGTLEANVDATGDAIFRTTGTIVGIVHCKRLVIEKGTDVTFLNKVYAEEVDIQARVTGSIISSGLLLIGANGVANGEVTARSVSIEPGGELNGAMNIVRGPAKPKPPEPAVEEPAV